MRRPAIRATRTHVQIEICLEIAQQCLDHEETTSRSVATGDTRERHRHRTAPNPLILLVSPDGIEPSTP